MAKARPPIPASTAAAVLFAADRTCCVCREGGSPLQLHHIDEDPTNNEIANLAVLCLACHDQTQIKGGFARRLDQHQVRLYRDDWNRMVAGLRSSNGGEDESVSAPADPLDADLATSLVEINREAGNHVNLALLFDSIGNDELRDKAIEKAIQDGATGALLVRLRRIQGRLREVPAEIIDQELAAPETFHAGRIREDLGDYRPAAESYISALVSWLDDQSDFAIAFYLKQVAEANVISGLFVNALQQAADDDDLWWQVRALEELGWTSELRALVVENQGKIDSADLSEEQRWSLRVILAEATGDDELFRQARMEYEKVRAGVRYS